MASGYTRQFPYQYQLGYDGSHFILHLADADLYQLLEAYCFHIVSVLPTHYHSILPSYHARVGTGGERRHATHKVGVDCSSFELDILNVEVLHNY